MEYSGSDQSSAACHVVAMPFPGRGHINPMMNFCKLLASRKHDILITFVVTEEWLGYIGGDPKPINIRFATIPNVIPPERLKAVDFPGFYEAVMTKMEAPFEQLIDRLDPPVTTIVGDIEVRWAIGLGNRRNIPVAAFWTMSATVLSMFYHLDVHIKQINGTIDLIEEAEEITRLSSNTVADLKTIFRRDDPRVLQLALECISEVQKAQYLLFTSVYELEPQIIDTLKTIFPFPIYTIGPAIPYLELELEETKINSEAENYIKWLDSQPQDSVLYISLGSFLSVSRTQMEEIAAGLKTSGVRFLWIARGDASRILNEGDFGDMGMVIPWCYQLRVLSHPAIGGFWTHCGWNSTLESVFSGVPMLTFPLFLDQDTNSMQIVEDWAIGRRTKSATTGAREKLLTGEEIADVVRTFMDSEEGVEIRRRAREFGEICRLAISKDGSSVSNLHEFIKNISL